MLVDGPNDRADIADWIRPQNWSTGKICTFALGFVAPRVAGTRVSTGHGRGALQFVVESGRSTELCPQTQLWPWRKCGTFPPSHRVANCLGSGNYLVVRCAIPPSPSYPLAHPS